MHLSYPFDASENPTPDKPAGENARPGRPLHIHRPARITLPPPTVDANMRDNGKYGSPGGFANDPRVMRDGDEFYDLESEELPHIEPRDNPEDSYLTFLPDAPEHPLAPQAWDKSPMYREVPQARKIAVGGVGGGVNSVVSSGVGGGVVNSGVNGGGGGSGLAHVRHSSLDARVNHAMNAGPTPPLPRRKMQLAVPSTPTSVMSSGSEELAIREDQQPTLAMQKVVRRSQYAAAPLHGDPLYFANNSRTDDPMYANAKVLGHDAASVAKPAQPAAHAAHLVNHASPAQVSAALQVPSFPVAHQGKHAYAEIQDTRAEMGASTSHGDISRDPVVAFSSSGKGGVDKRVRPTPKRHPAGGAGGGNSGSVRRYKAVENHLYEIPDNLAQPLAERVQRSAYGDEDGGDGDGEGESGPRDAPTLENSQPSSNNPGEESEGSEEIRRMWEGESDESDAEGDFYSVFGGQGREGPTTSSQAAKDATIRAPDQNWAADFIAKFLPVGGQDWRHDARARQILDKVAVPDENPAESP
jgi:hypothetical protein